MVTPFCRRSAERRLAASEDTEYPTRRLRDRKSWRMSARQRHADCRADNPGTIDRTTWASRTSILMRGSTFAIRGMFSRALRSGVEAIRIRRRVQPADRLVRHGRDWNRYWDFAFDGGESTHAVCVEHVHERPGRAKWNEPCGLPTRFNPGDVLCGDSWSGVQIRELPAIIRAPP